MAVRRFFRRRATRMFTGALTALVMASAGAGGSKEATATGLGDVDFRASCAAEVSEDFNRAVAMLHHMMYAQAREAFDRIAAEDSDCAMAHWGIAQTLFHPLWPTRPGAGDEGTAREMYGRFGTAVREFGIM